MMKTFRLFGLVALLLVLFGCQPGSNDNNDPEPPANVQHGNIGDVICINGYYYKITNNFNPYTVELEKEGYTASSSAAPKRVASQNNADSPYEGEVVIPSVVTYDGAEFAVTAIGESAFYNKNVKSVYIPGCVEKVGLNAFRMCYNMEKMTLCNGIKKIESHAFSGCRKCTTITIPRSVEQMGECAFEECYYWTRLNIESGVKQIGYAAFERRNYPTSKSYVYCYSTEPPTITSKGSNCEAFTITNCELYVPKGSASVYKKTAGWKNFSTIREMN